MDDEQELVERLKRHESQIDQRAVEIDQADFDRARNYLNEVFRQNASQPVSVRSVHIVGGGATVCRPSFLESHIAPIRNATTVQELIQNIDEVHMDLAQMGVFEHISVALDESPSSSSVSAIPTVASIIGAGNRGTRPIRGQSDLPLQIDAQVHLASAKRFLAKTGTDIGNGEGNGYINATWKNAFGGAEIVSIDASLGTSSLNVGRGSSSQTSYQASLALPCPPILASALAASQSGITIPSALKFKRTEIMSYIANRPSPWSSTDHRVRGLMAKLTSNDLETGVEASWRTVSCMQNAAASVRSQAGSDIKLGAFWAYTKNSHDNLMLPTKGARIRIHQELATVTGHGPSLSSIPFVKSTLESSVAFSALQNRIITKFALRAGTIWKPNAFSAVQTPLLDRFYIGGPNDLRGFNLNTAGPREKGDSLGGDAFVTGGINVLTPLTKKAPLFLSGFINAGSAGPLTQQSVASMIQAPSISSGFGIVYCHPSARFELNFTLPLVAREMEGTRKGLQFGVGFSFL